MTEDQLREATGLVSRYRRLGTDGPPGARAAILADLMRLGVDIDPPELPEPDGA